MRSEIITLNKSRNVTLTIYLQSVGGEFSYVPKRPAILILPGGGYQFCSDREADPVAMPYLKAGYQVFILRYSVQAHNQWPNPLEDYEQAMCLIRAKAKEWNVYEDKVAVIGFSAGGHLAAAAATMAENKPNAAILGYGVMGKDVKGCNASAPDTVDAVDQYTCPCFIFSTRDDGLVHIDNSLDFMKALSKYQIAFESHIYAFGPHGFSTCDASVQNHNNRDICSRIPNWVEDSIGWLQDMFGGFGEGKLNEAVCKPHVTDNYKAFLSVDCTIGHLLMNAAARAILTYLREQSQGSGTVDDMVQNMTLREAMHWQGVKEEIIVGVNEQLGRIENRI
ncbi:MAG: alpha/beta hydrolase [Lachnospiraceae bacterium]|nr:alpha/beta hydrolase [Lachnospiraceae bacterium]